MRENWAIIACYSVRSSLSLVLCSGDDEIAISGCPCKIDCAWKYWLVRSLQVIPVRGGYWIYERGGGGGTVHETLPEVVHRGA